MLQFRPLAAADFEIAAPILHKQDYKTTETSFAALYLWRGLSGCEIATSGETVFFRVCWGGVRSYLFPYGGDLKTALSEIFETEKAEGNACVNFVGITEKMKEAFENAFPGEFSYKARRSSFDYIYKAEVLAALAGRALRQKRNHVNKFQKKYNGRYSYAPMTETQIPEVLEFQKKWIESISSKDGEESLLYENEAIKEILTYFSEFGLSGGVLRVDGEICAYCIGFQMNENTVDIMVEKGDYSFDGVYQMINKCFAEQMSHTAEYLNREDDMGIEGLRKSKLTYCPEILMGKYNVIWKR